ncbi:MAG TPA: alkaline phosphatase family protein [Candidatus Nitrosotenuis sp.]|nr:alkaline phosphatase family protein [Candidatus Nitrosotenuis sp.]
MPRLCLLLAALVLLALPALAQPPRPRLVVLMVIDQLANDHLYRLQDHFGPGGFRRLTEGGAWHVACLSDVLPTTTAVGHASLVTGAPPSLHGIVGNAWMEEGRVVVAVEDERYPVVGASGSGGFAPSRLLSSTLGDELKLSWAGQSRVVSVSLKDRAAILLGGRSADLALWFDSTSGRWVSSRWYRPRGDLPAWVEELNASGWLEAQFGYRWTPLLPLAARQRSAPSPQEGTGPHHGSGAGFPHLVQGGLARPGPEYYEAVTFSPLGDIWTLRLAREAVTREKLGRGPAPDVLAINLTSHDRVGHAFGPHSPEVQDLLLRLDGELASFFAFLDAEVGQGQVLLALAGDHGVAPLPEWSQQFRLGGGRFDAAALEKAVQSALEDRYGRGRDYLAGFVYPHLYLNVQGLSAAEARQVARQAARGVPGIFEAYTRDQIESGQLPLDPLGPRIGRSYFRGRSGDLEVVLADHWVLSRQGTNHASPWAYDAHVPLLLAGPGVRPGRRYRPATMQDLAPTLCALLGVSFPSACTGRVLEEDLEE